MHRADDASTKATMEEEVTYTILLGCLIITMLYLYVDRPALDRPLMWEGPEHAPVVNEPKMGFVCQKCGDDALGTWNDKMLCLACQQDEPIGQPPKRVMGFICHDCGEFEQVEEFTDETIGTWDDKMVCSACRQKESA